MTVTEKDGSKHKIDYIFIRGNQIEFFVMPEMFKNSPCLKAPEIKKRNAQQKKPKKNKPATK